jgi:putative two-component system response regulator
VPQMSSPKTVVIIDDDPDYVKAIAALLQGAGYVVHSASSGAEGLRLARSLVPDLVLLDVIMSTPHEGFTMLRELRGIPALAKTPVVIVSSLYACDQPVFHVSADAGWVPADLILSKPVDPARLLAEAARLTKH